MAGDVAGSVPGLPMLKLVVAAASELCAAVWLPFDDLVAISFARLNGLCDGLVFFLNVP